MRAPIMAAAAALTITDCGLGACARQVDQPEADPAGRGGGLRDGSGRKTLRARRPRRVSRLGAQADALELRPGLERVDKAAEHSGGHSPSGLRVRRRQALLGRRLHHRSACRSGLPAWVPSKSLWVYDINAKSWSKGPDLPTPRGALSATAVGTKIYAMGGAKNPSYSTPELRPNGSRGERCDQRGVRHCNRVLVLRRTDAHRAQPSWSRAHRRQDLRGRRPHRLDLHHRPVEQRQHQRGVRCRRRTPGHPCSACRRRGAGSGSPCSMAACTCSAARPT